MIRNKNWFSTRILAEIAVFISLATVLSFIKIFNLPQGGSVTAGSMVPILWLALRRGPKVGLFGAVLYGVVQLVVDPQAYHAIQVLIDYPIAFGSLGLAGFFQEKHLFIGVTLGVSGRFLAHFVSGIIFFSNFAPQGMNSALYSAMYNGGYLLVEFIISVYIIYLLKASKILNIHK